MQTEWVGRGRHVLRGQRGNVEVNVVQRRDIDIPDVDRPEDQVSKIVAIADVDIGDPVWQSDMYVPVERDVDRDPDAHTLQSTVRAGHGKVCVVHHQVADRDRADGYVADVDRLNVRLLDV